MPASNPVVYIEIVSPGPQSAVMIAETLDEAALTFWRFVHMKYAPFALEPVEFDNQGSTVRFGAANVRYQYPKQGDLVWATFAKVTLQGIFGADISGGTGAGEWSVYSDVNTEPYYTDAIGQYVLEKIEFNIGNSVVDTLYNYYLYIWEELSGKPGKRLREMIGKFDTIRQRQHKSRRSQILYVPLTFYFTQNTGLALPMVSLQFHSVSLNISFAARYKCVVTPFNASSPQTAIDQIYKRTDGVAVSTASALSSYTKLADTDLACSIEAYNVYLDDIERAKFSHGQFEQIMTEVQYQQDTATATFGTPPTDATAAVKKTIRLQFNHVVMEYIVAIRMAAMEEANQHFNFDGPTESISQCKIDPIRTMAIKFNNQERVRERPGFFFRGPEPYVHHTNLPQEYIYCWSFAIDPEDDQPNGGANHSRIDNVDLVLNLEPRLFISGSSVDIFLIARNKNLLRFRMGHLSKKFGT